MSRRVRTLAASAVLLLVLVVLAATLRVPYVILGPGPTYNTLGADDAGAPIIAIDGRSPNDTSGNLNLTTVSVRSQNVTVFEAIKGWLAGDRVVVPRETVYPPGRSTEEVNKSNTQDFVNSQDSAQTAAFCELGYPDGLGVSSISAGSLAAGVLQVGDVLLTINGAGVGDIASLTALLSGTTPGQVADVGIARVGVESTVKVTLVAAADGSTGGRLGISVSTGCHAPFKVDLGLANSIGGPSAGLMFALGIIDMVGDTDLTGGKFIAGTGTITAAGQVGPIGGIPLKMIAAKRAGATVFLAPADNCGEVRGNTPDGLTVIRVDTLHGAIEDLKDLQDGGQITTC
ncbi:MAG: Endopeptidase La [Pseudonocardiales bacterium]|nr:Endopeptidase La [Pseudonocardiales bacterium]